MRIGKRRITIVVEHIMYPVDAVAEKVIAPGLYVCKGCGWAFRFMGGDTWHGAYWRTTKNDRATQDERGEWAGYPKFMNTEQLSENYADCFGKLQFAELILARVWTVKAPKR